MTGRKEMNEKKEKPRIHNLFIEATQNGYLISDFNPASQSHYSRSWVARDVKELQAVIEEIISQNEMSKR